MKGYIKLLRISHWLKNLFLFLPLFFSGVFIENSWIAVDVAIGFICFSLIASVVYIINDIKDVDDDREHPEKKNRPFAAGTVKISTGVVLAIVLALSSATIAYWLDPKFLIVLGVYFLMNLAYSLKLKHVPLLDISIIAMGFVLRVIGGGLIPETDIYVSHWILIMTFLLALFLGFAKRRDDVKIFLESGKKMRKSIDGYNMEFINTGMSLMGGVTIVSYIMYTISDEVTERLGHNLYITSLFVILGVLRYLQITFVQEKSGNPTKVLVKDLFIQLILVGFILTFGILLYINYTNKAS
jgi:decaprenyl-phosphate phosphoribosyltransferase